MPSSLEICNAALMRLGSEPIDAFTDNKKRAKLCLAHYNRIKKDLISNSPWNFSLKKAELLPDIVTITTTEILFATDEITLTNHKQASGQRIVFKTTTGSAAPTGIYPGQTYFLIKVDANTVKLANTYKEALEGTAISFTDTGTGSFDILYASLFNYDYRFNKPVDYLTIFRVEPEQLEYRVEGDYILANDETFKMIYQSNVNETEFSIYFNQALILKLAVEFSYSLIQSNELRAVLIEEADLALRSARLKDSQEGSPYAMTVDNWRTSRL